MLYNPFERAVVLLKGSADASPFKKTMADAHLLKKPLPFKTGYITSPD
jgi:hypothetical protein